MSGVYKNLLVHIYEAGLGVRERKRTVVIEITSYFVISPPATPCLAGFPRHLDRLQGVYTRLPWDHGILRRKVRFGVSFSGFSCSETDFLSFIQRHRTRAGRCSIACRTASL